MTTKRFGLRTRRDRVTIQPLLVLCLAASAGIAADGARSLRFHATRPVEVVRWQGECREKLFGLLMGGAKPAAVPLQPEIVSREDSRDGACVIEELTFQSVPDRRAHVWVAVPRHRQGRVGAVLAINGHGGSGEEVVRGKGLYWYGRSLAELGYVVIAPDVGQHTLQHTNWTLMGERVWDALRCLDYLATRPEVDTNRLAVAGLSLGGETTMYVAALDERLKAVCSSGWLTTVDNMKRGHCPCWNFPGLEQHFDFADIFACVAPRPMVLEIGEQERAPGGFPVEIAQRAFAELRAAYRVLGAADAVQLVIHPGGHVFEGARFWDLLAEVLGTPAGFGANVEVSPAAADRSAGADRQYLVETTKKLLAGCQIAAADGTRLYTPDGKGNYRALWTRDFAYMVENAGDFLPVDGVEAALRLLIKGVRGDGAAPDRVRPDGVPVYVAGSETAPLGEPNLDNAQFLVLAMDAHLQRLAPRHRLRRFREWAPVVDRAMNYIPRSSAGLVVNDPGRPHSPYGFTDTIGKTGELLFESLLYWTASERMAAWHERYGGARAAADYRQRAALIATNIFRLWDSVAGAFVAATWDCRQIDIWGNAYALWIDFPLGARRETVIEFLSRHRGKFLREGQVRHLLAGEHWERLLTPVAPERYQNGAYWATASGWMMWALAQKDAALAREVWTDVVASFRRWGVFECVNEGYRQLDSYVVSATNPLAAARRLRF